MHGAKVKITYMFYENKEETFNHCLLDVPAQSIFHLGKFNLKLVYGKPNGSFQYMYGQIEGFVGTRKDVRICRWM
jgi:hypothetical protein